MVPAPREGEVVRALREARGWKEAQAALEKGEGLGSSPAGGREAGAGKWGSITLSLDSRAPWQGHPCAGPSQPGPTGHRALSRRWPQLLYSHPQCLPCAPHFGLSCPESISPFSGNEADIKSQFRRRCSFPPMMHLGSWWVLGPAHAEGGTTRHPSPP